MKASLIFFLLTAFTLYFTQALADSNDTYGSQPSSATKATITTPQPGGSTITQPANPSIIKSGDATATSTSGAATQSGAAASAPSGATVTQPNSKATSPSGGTAAAQPSKTTTASQASNVTPSSNPNPTDSSIITNIQASIASNNDVSKLNIDVNSKNGTVKLIGNANDNTQASTLVEIAASTAGVKSVNTTGLSVNNKPPIKDNLITAMVKGSFIREKLFNNISMKNIVVNTNNGVVTLTGTIDSQAQMDKILKLVKSIKGISKVVSKLTVTE